MKKRNSKNKAFGLFILFALVLPTVVFGLYHYYRDNLGALPYYGEKYSIETNRNTHYKIPNLHYTNQLGQNLQLAAFEGNIKVINFFFTTCKTICPPMMANLRKVQEAFATDNRVTMVSISVDPESDSVAKLKSYADNLNIVSEKWQLATGDKVALYQFARKGVFLTVTDGDGGEDDFIHSEKIVLVDRDDHIRGYYDGTDKTAIQQLISDIKRIK